jgi:hypothetical protein
MSSAGRQLANLIDKIASPAASSAREGELFAAVPIPASPRNLVGRDAAGCVAILIAIDTNYPLGPLPPVQLENLSVAHAARCTVAGERESPVTGVFSVVRCLSNDQQLVQLFIDVMASVALQFPASPSATDAANVLGRVIRLFRDLGKPSERTVQGLWSELLVIAGSRNPIVVAAAWRSVKYERTDFATSDQRLEVKSTTGVVRSHSFSADQLRVPRGTRGVVASLICQKSTGGVSVSDLWKIVREAVAADPSLTLRVDEVIAETLGEAWKQSLSVRYDWQTARDSLRFYRMESVPSIGTQPPPEVSEIRFRVDLSRVESLTPVELRSFGGLFEAVVP